MRPTATHPSVTCAPAILAGMFTLIFGLSTAFAGTAEGIKAFKFGDYQKAYEQLSSAARRGDTEAQFYLGRMYTYGRGVETNSSVAFDWYLKAAEGGHQRAMAIVGYAYDKGIGVAEDDAKAVAWYRKSAQQGDVAAQRNLGLMYRNGESVERDYTEAVKWFRRASEQEDGGSQKQLCGLYQFGFGVPQDHRRASYWCRRAAENGNAAAQSALQSMILQGLAEGDAVSAYAWALYSAKQDHPGGLQAWEYDNRKWFLSEAQAERARAIVESGEWPDHPRFTEAEQERLRQRGSGRVMRLH